MKFFVKLWRILLKHDAKSLIISIEKGKSFKFGMG
jgi:hypothetical protein